MMTIMAGTMRRAKRARSGERCSCCWKRSTRTPHHVARAMKIVWPSVDDTRSLAFKRHLELLAKYFSLPVKRMTERIDDTTHHLLAYVDGGNTTSTMGSHSLLNAVGGAKQHGADVVFLKVHDNGHEAIVKLQQLASLGMGEAAEADDAVAHLQHLAYFLVANTKVNALQLPQQHF